MVAGQGPLGKDQQRGALLGRIVDRLRGEARRRSGIAGRPRPLPECKLHRSSTRSAPSSLGRFPNRPIRPKTTTASATKSTATTPMIGV